VSVCLKEMVSGMMVSNLVVQAASPIGR
jgi:hypothetical protein